MATYKEVSKFRFNPFTETYNPKEIKEELMCKKIDELNVYGMYVSEGIYFDIETDKNIEILNLSRNNNKLNEVEKSKILNRNEYKVDYSRRGDYGTSLIEFHPSHAGEKFQVTYKGIGTILNEDSIKNSTNLTIVDELSGKLQDDLYRKLQGDLYLKLQSDLYSRFYNEFYHDLYVALSSEFSQGK